jgi:hypothetical protein
MMKNDSIILIILLVLTPTISLAQNSYNDYTVIKFTHSVQFDTVYNPKYYEVYISIKEYEYEVREKNKFRTYLFNIDSLSKKMNLILESLIYKGGIALASASSDKENYWTLYPVKKTEQYKIVISNREQLEHLYRNLKFKGLEYIVAAPVYDNNDLLKLKAYAIEQIFKKSKSILRRVYKDSNLVELKMKSSHEQILLTELTFGHYNKEKESDGSYISFSPKPYKMVLTISYELIIA